MSFDLQSRKDRSDAGYLCLSIDQMAFVRQILNAAGMLDNEVEMPEISEFGNESRSPHPRKVPAIKFQSNDWWLVEAEECGWLADALENRVRNAPEMVPAAERADMDLEPLTAALQGVIPGCVATVPRIVRDQCAAVLADFAAFCRKCAHEGGFSVS